MHTPHRLSLLAVALAGADAPALQVWVSALDRAQSASAQAPQLLCRLVSGRPMQLATLAPLAAVCVAPGSLSAEDLAELALAVAQRPGAIIPVISAASASDPKQLYRFCAEQTLTINTAAAGGNAALLAGAAHA